MNLPSSVSYITVTTSHNENVNHDSFILPVFSLASSRENTNYTESHLCSSSDKQWDQEVHILSLYNESIV